MTSLVSVCIPTYEQPDLAVRAATSALQQEGRNIEVIIADDSRDDRVRDALTPLLADSRIKYFKNETRIGAVNNWNKSVSLASSPIINILHHDDMFNSKHSVMKLTAPIIDGGFDISFCAFMNSASDGTKIKHVANREQLDHLKSNAHHILLGNFLGDPSICAFKRDTKARFDSRFMWVSDIEFFCNAIIETNGNFFYVDESLVDVSSGGSWQISRQYDNNPRACIIEYAILLSKHRREATHNIKSDLKKTIEYFIKKLEKKEAYKIAGELIVSGEIIAAATILRIIGAASSEQKSKST